MSAERMQVARGAIRECFTIQQTLLEEDRLAEIVRAADVIGEALAAGGKFLLFGNGGSASDASHVRRVQGLWKDGGAVPANDAPDHRPRG
jgi:phosphoheptose isomerase